MRKRLNLFSMVFMALIMLASPLMASFVPAVVAKKAEESQAVCVRTVELSTQEIDCQGVFSEYEDANLVTLGAITSFEGVKKIDSSIFSEVDNLSVTIDVTEL